MLHGIWVKYVDTAFVYQQALSSPYKLMRQRSRWVQGNLDCAKYFKRAIMNTKINGTQKIGILYFLVQPWLNVAADVSVFGLFLISVSKISTLLMDKPSLTGKFLIMLPLLWLFSLFWGVFFEVVYLNDLRKTAETGVSKWQLIALPIIVSYLYLLLFGSLIMAFWRKAIGNNSWVKTARKSA